MAKPKQNRRTSKAQLRRRAPVRSVNLRYLIVCEDSVSAPNYFKALRAHLGLTSVDVEVCGEQCGSSPKSVVDYAYKYARSEGDFDFVFCVIDRDTHESFQRALDRANGIAESSRRPCRQFTVVPSVPCFELWYILHFEMHTPPYSASGGKSPAGNLIANLRKFPGFENYDKGTKGYFEVLLPLLGVAKTNAALLEKYCVENGSDNPSTTIHHLVISLERAKEDVEG